MTRGGLPIAHIYGYIKRPSVYPKVVAVPHQLSAKPKRKCSQRCVFVIVFLEDSSNSDEDFLFFQIVALVAIVAYVQAGIIAGGHGDLGGLGGYYSAAPIAIAAPVIKAAPIAVAAPVYKTTHDVDYYVSKVMSSNEIFCQTI